MKNPWILGLVVFLFAALTAVLALSQSRQTSRTEAADSASETIASSPVPDSTAMSEAEILANAPENLPSAAGPGFYTETEYAQFKAEYYCDLARDVRAQCEAVDRGDAANEQCLKLSQYYTYSRHCGSQP